MTDMKPWFLSRTVWASLATVLLALAGLLALPVGDGDHASLTESLLQLASGVAGIVALIGRLSARARIG